MALVAKKKKLTRPTSIEQITFKRQLLRGTFRIVLVGLMLWFVYYVTRLPAFSITTIEVVGGETISHDIVRARLHDELVGSYFLLIPKNFTYLYPHDRMQEVLEKIPGTYDISIVRTSRQTLDVAFKEYVPHALWCMHENESAPCYFINEKGYAFMEAPRLKGGSFMRHSIEGLTEIHPGDVITEDVLNSLDQFVSRLENELGLRIHTVIHKRNKDYEFVINGGGSILVASDKLQNETFDNLKSILESKEFKHLEPGNFKYIDVRFENKIFVNESKDTPATTSTTTVASSTLPE